MTITLRIFQGHTGDKRRGGQRKEGCRAGKENETALKVWMKTCTADLACVTSATYQLEETTFLVFKAWLGFLWGPRRISLVLACHARYSNRSNPSPWKSWVRARDSGVLGISARDTGDLPCNRQSNVDMATGLEFSSGGKNWRRPWLCFPLEPCTTDFLAARNPVYQWFVRETTIIELLLCLGLAQSWENKEGSEL